MKNKFYRFKIFSPHKNIVYGFSVRKFGSIKNNGNIDNENLKRFVKTVNVNLEKVVFAKQVHGKSVSIIGNSEKNIIRDTDGLITKQKNIFLFITTADCLPLIFYDPVKENLGVAHAGYKGILVGIIKNMIEKFMNLGSRSENIMVGIGPSIGSCCYSVSRERISEFKRTFGDIAGIVKTKNKERFLDLKLVASCLLEKYGIIQKNIQVLPVCTKCSMDQFFSFRGDSRETFGEFVTFAGMI